MSFVYTLWFLATNTGKVSVPASFLSSVMWTFLSVTTYSTLQFGSTTVSCIRTQFLTTAPFLILQPRNSTLFSTVPSMTQPSASRLFLTELPSR